jgi:hypothetical protein
MYFLPTRGTIFEKMKNIRAGLINTTVALSEHASLIPTPPS